MSLFHAGDIWSENGVSLLGILGYWINKHFELKEKLLEVEGWGRERHTGDNIKKKTLDILHNVWGIGTSPDDVPNCVHGSTPDEGSNMLKAWNCFEGGACVCHRAQSALRCALKINSHTETLVRKVKGIVAHFHRSQKVCCLCWMNLIIFTTLIVSTFVVGLGSTMQSD